MDRGILPAPIGQDRSAIYAVVEASSAAGAKELRIVAAVVWNPVIKPVLLGLLSAAVAGILQIGKAMYKLLSSTALALVLATPVWAEEPSSGAVGTDEPTVADTGRLLIAQDTESQDVEEEETQGVMESQPGVTTGEEVDDEDAGAMATGSTGGPDEKGSAGAANDSDGGDTAEGSGAAGDSGAGSESSGSSGDSSSGSSSGSSD